MSKRRRLGPIYTSYPVRDLADMLGENTFKAFSSLSCCAIFAGIYYVIIAVVNFLRENVLEGSTPMSNAGLYLSTPSLLVLGICFVIICVLVFKSHLGKKVKIKQRGPRIVSIFLLLGILFAGCATTEEKTGHSLAHATKESYPKVEDYKIEFSLLKKEYAAGTPNATLLVGVKNVNNKPLRLEDWRINHPDNIKIYIQPWLPGMDQPDANSWVSLNDKVKEPQWRYPLDLLPGNQALIEKPISFIADLSVSHGKERRYFVMCETNLQTVDVKSDVMAIAVYNKDDMARMEERRNSLRKFPSTAKHPLQNQ